MKIVLAFARAHIQLSERARTCTHKRGGVHEKERARAGRRALLLQAGGQSVSFDSDSDTHTRRMTTTTNWRAIFD